MSQSRSCAQLIEVARRHAEAHRAHARIWTTPSLIDEENAVAADWEALAEAAEIARIAGDYVFLREQRRGGEKAIYAKLRTALKANEK